TCDPGQFNDWARQQWNLCDTKYVWVDEVGSPEEFIDGIVQGVFHRTASCWSVSPPLAPVLARATQAWNNTHSSSSTRTITFPVNVTCASTFGGSTTQLPGQSYSAQPIAVALNEAALSSKLPANSTLSFSVNTGPLVKTQPQAPSPAGSR